MAALESHVEESKKKRTSSLPKDKQFLDTFWKLAVPSDTERIKGATNLLHILISKQNEANEVSITCLDIGCISHV